MLFNAKAMGFTESEFWKFTLRKYLALKEEFESANKPPEERDVFADELPF